MTKKQWTFFTNHSHVLFFIHSNPEFPMKEIAAQVGITERAVHSIVRDLEDAKIITITKEGRQNRYEIDHDVPLRHQIESHRKVSELLSFINKQPGGGNEKTEKSN